MSASILHITSRAEWLAAQATGRYVAPSLASEGFIHCSQQHQVLPVAEKFYRGQDGLVLLVIDPARLDSPLKWEAPAEGGPPPGVAEGDPFPHIYGPINLEAVLEVLDLSADRDGRFVLPASLSADPGIIEP
jgi:uncharacterized protein (DUF952 family)